MYAPLLRGKQNELIAFRELSARIAESDLIIPIFEPVKGNSTTTLSFDKYAEESMRFMLLVNPRVGDLTTDGDVEDRVIGPCLAEYDNYIPAFYADGGTTYPEIATFIEMYASRGLELALVYSSETAAGLSARLVGLTEIRYHVFFEGKTSTIFRSLFPAEKSILLSDVFSREERNADYPPQEFFSDRHLRVNGLAGFGDYSIAGSHYAERGGAANAVALHHVYFSDGRDSALHMRHFISDRTTSTVDTAGKFIEALRKLVHTIPALGLINRTPTCEEYEHLLSIQHFPGLGCAKKLALKHHFELFL